MPCSSNQRLVARTAWGSCRALVVNRPATAEVARAGPRGPEDERQQDSDDADDQQDPADRVDVDAGNGRIHGEGENSADSRKYESYSESHELLLLLGSGRETHESRFEVRPVSLSSRLRKRCAGAPSSRSWGSD